MITRDVLIILTSRDVMAASSALLTEMATDAMAVSSVLLMATDVMVVSSVPSMVTEETAVSVTMTATEDLLIQTDRMQDQDRALAATEAASTRMMTDVITTEAASAASRVADQDRRVIILFPTARLRTQRSIETRRNVVSARRRIRRTARI